MSDPSATLKMMLQVVGISAASALAGASAAQSLIAMPALLKSEPTMLVKQFDTMAHSSMRLLKPATMGSTIIFSILTYLSYTPSEAVPTTTVVQWKLFATASIFAFAVIPYTVLTLAPLGHKMEEFVTKVNLKSTKGSLSSREEQDVKSTLAKWTKMNQGRAFLPFIASVLALVASVVY